MKQTTSKRTENVFYKKFSPTGLIRYFFFFEFKIVNPVCKNTFSVRFDFACFISYIMTYASLRIDNSGYDVICFICLMSLMLSFWRIVLFEIILHSVNFHVYESTFYKNITIFIEPIILYCELFSLIEQKILSFVGICFNFF